MIIAETTVGVYIYIIHGGSVTKRHCGNADSLDPLGTLSVGIFYALHGPLHFTVSFLGDFIPSFALERYWLPLLLLHCQTS